MDFVCPLNRLARKVVFFEAGEGVEMCFGEGLSHQQYQGDDQRHRAGNDKQDGHGRQVSGFCFRGRWLFEISQRKARCAFQALHVAGHRDISPLRTPCAGLVRTPAKYRKSW